MATALTATLRADITQFERAITQAETKISGLQRSTTQVNRELAKFGNDFGGANLIRQANSMAKAVEDIGGVTKLTTAEQKRLSSTVDEALAKYRALGQEVPPKLVGISTELGKIRAANEAAEKSAKAFADVQKRAAGEATAALEKTAGSGGLIGNVLRGLGPAFAATFSVGAVVSFGKEMIALGSEISDMASRTGLGVEQVQAFTFAAQQTGATLEDVTKATEKLSDKLASGDKGAVASLTQLGISFDHIRQLSPGDAFTEVADAIGKIPDPMERTQLALDLFGKSGAKLLPAINEGFSDLVAKAHELGVVIHKEDIEALDKFGDQVDVVTLQVKTGLVSAFFDVKRGIADITESLKGLGTSLPQLPDWLQQASRLATQGTNLVRSVTSPTAILDFGVQQLRGRGAAAREGDRVQAFFDKAQADEDAASLGKVSKATENFTDKLKAVGLELAKLNAAEKAQIAAAGKLHESSEAIANTLNSQHQGLELTAVAIDVYNKRLEESSAANKKAATEEKQLTTELEKKRKAFDTSSYLGTIKAGAEATAKFQKEQIAMADKTATEISKSISEVAKDREEADRNYRRMTQSSTQFAIGEIKLQLDKQLDAIRQTTLGEQLKAAQIESSSDRAASAIQLEISKTKEFKGALYEVLAAVGEFHPELLELEKGATKVHKSLDWADSINDLGRSFSQLAQIGGDGLDGLIGKIGEMIGLMGIGAQAGKQLADQFRNKDAKGKIIPMGQAGAGFTLDSFRNSDGNFSTGSVAGGAAQAAPGIVASIGALDQATNVKGRGNRAARGALTGASIGGQIAGPYGALAGLAVGALVGALRNPAFEDVYKRVAKNFGVQLSDETAKAIAKVAKDQFKGDRQSAEVFSLDAIIGEGGGLKKGNVDQLTARLRDSFSLFQQGKFSDDQLTEVLTKNFSTFADFVGKSTEIAGKGFADIAKLAKEAGVDIESINAFVSQQTGRVGGGLEALSAPLFETAGLSEQVKAAKAAQQAAAEAVTAARGGKSEADLGVGDKEAVAAAQQAQEAAAQALADITAKMAAGTKDAQAEFDRLGIIAVGAFNAARASGLGYLEAVDQLSPGLDRLKTIQDELGLAGNAAFDELSKFRDLVGQNETLVGSAEALNETILALSNIGGLTVDTLAAMEGQGLETFDRLTAAGFTSGQSIEIMRGFIENLKKAHEQLGVPIDANTQALIDQADALEGLGPKSPAQALAEGFKSVTEAVNRLAKGLGIDVPEAANTAAAAVEASAARSSAAATASAQEIATKGGGAFIELERTASKAQDGISDKIRDAAERGVFHYRNFADKTGELSEEAKAQLAVYTQEFYRAQEQALKDAEAGLRTFVDTTTTEISRIPRDIDIRFRTSVSGDMPGDPTSGGDAPGLATGGIVRARAGGTIVRLAEGGRDEAVIPLGSGSSQGITLPMLVSALSQIQFTGVLEGGGRPLLRYVSREVGNYIETRTGQRVPL